MAFVEEIVVTKLWKLTNMMSLAVRSPSFGSRGMYLVAEETARDVNLFAPDNDNFLSVENLFGNNGGESTQEMALSIYYDGGRRDCGHDKSRLWGSDNTVNTAIVDKSRPVNSPINRE